MKPVIFTLGTAIIALCVAPLSVFSQQPRYVFDNPVRLSGAERQEGTVYKYTNVYPNTDAHVTIVRLSNNLTLATFDATTSGFREAFQPVINCPANRKAYAEFRVDFVEHSNNNIAKVMPEVPITSLDIDGYAFSDDNIYEFTQFRKTPNYYVNFSMSGRDLMPIASNTNWYEVINQSAVVYTGIDTSFRGRDVMFNMTSASVSSVSIRIGTDNKSTTNDQRQSSVYFQNFIFQNSVLLSEPRIENLNGFTEQSRVTLEWKLSAVDQLRSIVVEKAESPEKFTVAGEITIKQNEQTSFRFEDNNPGSEKVYYRIKLVTMDGEVGYSKVLPFRLSNIENAAFTVFPTVVQNDLMLRVKSEKRAPGILRIINYAGNVVRQQTVSLHDGMNTVLVDEVTRIPAGNYIAMLETNGKTTTQKIIKL